MLENAGSRTYRQFDFMPRRRMAYMFRQWMVLEPLGLAHLSHDEKGFKPSMAIFGLSRDSTSSHFLVFL